MGAERRNYVMSVELAMQREMAYRKKLESLQAERGRSSSSSSIITSSKKDPLLSQVAATAFTQSPRMTPGPRPTPNPLPHCYFGPRPGLFPPPRPNTWHHGPTPSPTPLMRPPFPTSGPTHSANHHKRKQPQAHQVGGNFYCSLCEVDCTSPLNLKMHLKGNKHSSKFKEGKSAYTKAAAGGTGAKGRFHCDLCGIWCPDEFSFRLHLNGKNHILKLYATNEKKLKGPGGGTSAI